LPRIAAVLKGNWSGCSLASRPIPRSSISAGTDNQDTLELRRPIALQYIPDT